MLPHSGKSYDVRCLGIGEASFVGGSLLRSLRQFHQLFRTLESLSAGPQLAVAALRNTAPIAIDQFQPGSLSLPS